MTGSDHAPGKAQNWWARLKLSHQPQEWQQLARNWAARGDVEHYQACQAMADHLSLPLWKQVLLIRTRWKLHRRLQLLYNLDAGNRWIWIVRWSRPAAWTWKRDDFPQGRVYRVWVAWLFVQIMIPHRKSHET